MSDSKKCRLDLRWYSSVRRPSINLTLQPNRSYSVSLAQIGLVHRKEQMAHTLTMSITEIPS